MKKQLVFTVFLVLAVLLSACTISASELNVTDSYAMNLVDDTSDASVPIAITTDSSDISVSSDSNVDNDSSKVSLSSEEVLGSENSNTLSTNMESDSNLSSSDDNVLAATKSTQITSPTTSIYYKAPFTVTLKDSDGNVIAGQTVKFVINGKNYSATTNAKGVASVSLSLAPGKYTTTVSYGGNSNYTAADTLSTTVNVLATIKSKDITKYYKGSTKYTATFYTSQGAALANTNVKISVNGKTYTQKTSAKGVASLAVNLKPGTYKVTVTDPKTGYTLTNTFKILSTISASDVSKVYTDGKKFSAKFLKSNGKVLANKNIKFKINGKTYTAKTNSKGVATLTMYNLKPGTYKMVSYNVDGLTKTNTVKVVKTAKTTLTTSDYVYLTSDSKTLKVTLKNQFGYAPSSGKVIKFTVNGKSYTAKTNSNGVASLKLSSISNGAYTVKYSFAGNSYYKASSASGKLTVIPSKTPTYTVKSTTTFGYGAGTQFKVALTSGGVPLAKKTVTFNVNNASYTKTTDSNGVVSLAINLNAGNYTVKYNSTAGSKYDAASASTNIIVKERTKTTVTWKSATNLKEGTESLSVLLRDSKSKAISGATVKLTYNSKSYSATTSSTGYAKFSVNMVPGNQTVSYSFNGDNFNLPSSGNTKVVVEKAKTISVKNIIAGAKTLKTYYANNAKLPSTVTAGGITFTVPQFLYLMSKAIDELGNSKTADIAIMDSVSAPSSSSGDSLNADLTKANYIKLANAVANFISSNKKAPVYATSTIGKVSYNDLVDSFSRILAFYGNNNNNLPNYVSYKTSSASSGSGLNEKNTIKDLTPYLKSSTNCQVNSSAIKNIVNSVTKGLTTSYAKANAIYKYVRDSVAYSFYYDTKYGATGTLNSKKGNCVDQAHLLVAMFRTAGLPARYVHGTCTFSSGSTYGHVWTQVLIDGKWTVADATSSRNSLGSIANWNTKSFSLKGIYSSISF